MSETVTNQLKNLAKLLEVEKTEDFTQYRDKIQALSLDQKKQKGYCWYPVQLDKSGYTYGSRAFAVSYTHLTLPTKRIV